jgi:hypothetical protein
MAFGAEVSMLVASPERVPHALPSILHDHAGLTAWATRAGHGLEVA